MTDISEIKLYHNDDIQYQKKKLITIRILEEDRERLKSLAKSQKKSLQRFCFDVLMSNFDK